MRSLAGDVAHESFVAGSSVPTGPLSSAGIARLVAATADRSRWSGERHAVLDPLGGAVAQVSVSATAFPWRGAPFTVQWYAKLPLSHPAAQVSAAQRWGAASRAALAGDMPGAYVNYASADVTDPSAYFGPNLPRLRMIKAAVDPANTLAAPTGIQR
jgi:hypothetical protein